MAEILEPLEIKRVDGVIGSNSAAAPQDNSMGVLDTLWGVLKTETTIGNVASKPAKVDPTNDTQFNPWYHAEENKDDLRDVWDYLPQIADANNQEEFDRNLTFIRERKALRDELQERGSIMGHVLALPVQILEPSLLDPILIGKAAKIAKTLKATSSLTKRIAKGSAIGATRGAFDEAVLTGLDPTKETIDIVYGAGGGAILGGALTGGVHAYKGFKNKKNPLNKDHPNNPIIHSEEPTAHTGDLSAAEVGSAPHTHDPAFKSGPMQTIGKYLTGAKGPLKIPVAQIKDLKNDYARGILQRLYPGGMAFSKEAKQGIAVEPTVRDVFDWHLQRGEAIGVQFTEAWGRLNSEIAGVEHGNIQNMKQGILSATGRIKDHFTPGDENSTSYNPIGEVELKEVIGRRLTKTWQDNDFDELVKTLEAKGITDPDGAAKRILAVADEISEAQQKLSLETEDWMVKTGMITEDMRMGDKYGMAHIYDKNAFLLDPVAARGWLIRSLAKTPHDDWLDEVGLTDVWHKLDTGNATITADLAKRYGVRATGTDDVELTPEQINRFKESVLLEWSGDDLARRLRDTEDAVDDLMDAHDIAVQDVLLAGRALRVANSDLANKNIQAVRAAAKRMLTDKEAGRMIAAMDSNRVPYARQVKAMAERVDTAIKRADDAERALAEAKAMKEQIKDIKKQIDAEKKASGKDLKKAKGAAKRAQKATPLDVYTDQFILNVQGHGGLPMGHLDDVVGESARAKRRMIHYSKEQLREGMDSGFLQSDPINVMMNSQREIVKRLALRETFGITDQGGENFKAISARFDEEYNKFLSTLTEGSKEHTAARAEKDTARKLLEDGWKKHLGIFDIPDDPNGAALWFGEQLRNMNYVIHGGGFMISSLTDMGSVALQIGGKAFLPRYHKAVREVLKDAREEDLRVLISAVERTVEWSRSAKIADATMQHRGVGTPGTKKYKATNFISNSINGIGEAVNPVSGMSWWNSRGKLLAAVAQLDTISKHVKDYDALLAKSQAGDKKAEMQIATMAMHGIDQTRAKALAKQFDTHGSHDSNGVVMANLSEWSDPAAKRTIMMALKRASEAAILTPELGDVPSFMSKPLAKVIFQFQSFGFTAVNNYFSPAVQRAVQYKDPVAISSLLMAGALGGTVTMAKDLIRGGEVRERTATEWAYESLDRSGFFLQYSPYMDGLMKVTAGLQKEAFGAAIVPTSRYGQKEWWQAAAFGPSLSTVTNFGKLAVEAANGNPKAGETLMKVMPFKAQTSILNNIAQMATD